MSLTLTYPAQGAALVIGGSGGVGEAICTTLASAGSTIAFSYYRGTERAEKTATAVKAQQVACSSHRVNVCDADAVSAMVNAVVAQHGGIHTVIIAAGAQILFKAIADVDAATWRNNFDIDLHGSFNIIQATLPHLRESQGSYVALSTMAYHRILKLDGTSASPKAALEQLIRQVACEEGMNGIRANSVALGAINAGMGSIDGDSSILEDMGEAAIMALLANIHLGQRMGTAEEVANTVAFLSSQQASYITGQTLVVDGGATL